MRSLHGHPTDRRSRRVEPNGNDDVFVMLIDGTEVTLLTTNPAGDYDHAWSPDGSKLVFTSTRGGTPDLYTMSAAGSSQQPLTGGVGGEDDLPDWSHDGTAIAFDRIFGTTGNDYEIWRIGADGSNPVDLTTDPAHDYAPSFSADDTKIAFVSTRDGDSEIMVMNADAPNQSPLTTNGSTEADPDLVPPAPAQSGGVRGGFRW
ncbi:MAG: hypothetical protein M5U19_00605 [Microthrixaceae bacterium]|nr:hypothetical protein [Microthrixaceae bacterium]